MSDSEILITRGWLGWNPNDDEFNYCGKKNYQAKSAKEAKKLAMIDWDCDYINIRVERDENQDVLLYKGVHKKRWWVAELKKQEERKEKLNKFKDTDTFYIQNDTGYLGNSIMWWSKNSNGYTADIDKAEIYTKKEIEKMDLRDEDKIWQSNEVLSGIRRHVDAQYLDFNARI